MKGWTTLIALKGIRIVRREEWKNQNRRRRDQIETAETNGTAEAEGGTMLKGRERATATMFSEPGMWTILLVNLAM